MFSENDMRKFATENPNTKVIKFDDVPDAEVKLPDIDELSTSIVQLLEYMNDDNVISIMTTDKALFEKLVFEKFPIFADKYYSTFKGLPSLLTGVNLVNETSVFVFNDFAMALFNEDSFEPTNSVVPLTTACGV